MTGSLIPELLDCFPDVLVVEPGTFDGYGSFTASGPAVSYPARVTGKQRLVRGSDGQEHVSSVQALVAGAFGLTVQHRYTLPARFVPTVQFAIAVGHATDENGPHHERVFFP